MMRIVKALTADLDTSNRRGVGEPVDHGKGPAYWYDLQTGQRDGRLRPFIERAR